MLDIQLLRNDIDFVAERLELRGYKLDKNKFNKLEKKRKYLQITTQEIQNQRNVKSKEIGIAKSKGLDASEIMKEVASIGDELKKNEQELSNLQEEINTFLLEIPNIPHETVPAGNNEQDNQELRVWGEIPNFDFTPKEHFELAPCQKGGMDFELSAKLSGARFVILNGPIARLQRAIAQLMLDTHTSEHAYSETYVPYLVKSQCLYGTGQFPKFVEDQFETNNDLWLIPTSEVSLTNIVREQILEQVELPLKLTAFTPCFRKESGSYGKDTRGMIRQHQFEKVELVQIVEPKDSYAALEELTSHAETILQKLKIPYRVMNLCTGDIGFSAAKTYDLEVWLPGQNTYREIASCSNTEGFQARRMHARYKDRSTKKTEAVHTINGSGLAVGRTLVAVLENYQQEDGTIKVPEALKPYMNGIEIIV